MSTLPPSPSVPLEGFGTAPKTTLPLVLTCVSVAAIAMSVDAVPRYSEAAFVVGMALTVAFAIVTGKVIDAPGGARDRIASHVVLPAVFGAIVGMVVQALVLADIGAGGVKDLGGLIDTSSPHAWVLGGILLGGLPALAVAAFLLVAGRAVRRLSGHDGGERFHVAFTGFSGLLAAVGLLVVDPVGAPPLGLALAASAMLLLVAIRVDVARLAFLRRLYAGEERGFEIAPAERFANDPSLTPLVQAGGHACVLVRRTEGSYRAAAAEPIAVLGSSERATTWPVLRRQAVATAMLVAMAAVVLAAVSQG